MATKKAGKKREQLEPRLNWRNYVGLLNLPEAQSGNFQIRHIHRPRGYCESLANGRTSLFGGHPGGSVELPFGAQFHELLEGGSRWTTDLPIEQVQQRANTDGFYGRVLVGGLGVGFIAADLACRDDVEEVVVVELNRDVINLVKPHLLDGRRERQKIRHVHANLFDFLAALNGDSSGNEELAEFVGEDYDCAFYDIWQADGDGTFFKTVLPLRKLSAEHVELVTNWNEDIMRGQIGLGLQTRMITTEMPMLGGYESVEAAGRYTLDNLCEPRGDIFWDYSVNFFRWCRAHELRDVNDDAFREGYANYAAYLGMYHLMEPWLAAWAREMGSRGWDYPEELWHDFDALVMPPSNADEQEAGED